MPTRAHGDGKTWCRFGDAKRAVDGCACWAWRELPDFCTKFYNALITSTYPERTVDGARYSRPEARPCSHHAVGVQRMSGLDGIHDCGHLVDEKNWAAANSRKGPTCAGVCGSVGAGGVPRWSRFCLGCDLALGVDPHRFAGLHCRRPMFGRPAGGCDLPSHKTAIQPAAIVRNHAASGG